MKKSITLTILMFSFVLSSLGLAETNDLSIPTYCRKNVADEASRISQSIEIAIKTYQSVKSEDKFILELGAYADSYLSYPLATWAIKNGSKWHKCILRNTFVYCKEQSEIQSYITQSASTYQARTEHFINAIRFSMTQKNGFGSVCRNLSSHLDLRGLIFFNHLSTMNSATASIHFDRLTYGQESANSTFFIDPKYFLNSGSMQLDYKENILKPEFVGLNHLVNPYYLSEYRSSDLHSSWINYKGIYDY
jgi:hypothetical protein